MLQTLMFSSCYFDFFFLCSQCTKLKTFSTEESFTFTRSLTDLSSNFASCLSTANAHQSPENLQTLANSGGSSLTGLCLGKQCSSALTVWHELSTAISMSRLICSSQSVAVSMLPCLGCNSNVVTGEPGSKTCSAVSCRQIQSSRLSSMS